MMGFPGARARLIKFIGFACAEKVALIVSAERPERDPDAAIASAFCCGECNATLLFCTVGLGAWCGVDEWRHMVIS
jgi:hypothetical protein